MENNRSFVFDDKIRQCMLRDRHRLTRQWMKLKTGDQLSKEKVIAGITASINTANTRRQEIPAILYDEALPIAGKREDIAELITNNQVVIIAGETGSGKTTQLPKICLELDRGVFGMIGHTQPRRLAARSVSSRLAEELNVPLGQQVGYQIRFSDQTEKNTLIKVMTDGVLLAEIRHDPYLTQYDALIIDEAHERSLNIDFLLGYLKHLLSRRSDLKVIVTSATIDIERFSAHFNDAPVIEVSGRLYPVDLLYRPPELLNTDAKDKDELQLQGIAAALREIETVENAGIGVRRGDVLVFLSGEREIRETTKRLRDEKFRDTVILPLYARLSVSEQARIFHPEGTGRRVILATNVAETSLTVPGIHYVIDTGFARISRYSVHSRIQRLPVEPVSQASANQRKGRCGRIAEGLCIRLYSEDDFNKRPLFTDAEILRTSLASVILQMLMLRLGSVDSFSFIDKPEPRAINDGFKLLIELGAVTSDKKITTSGRQIASLPVDPKMGRMLLEANRTGSLDEVLIIVSALSVQDPRERPGDKRQAADEQHRAFFAENSDFLTLVNLWRWYEEQREALSQNQLRKLCKKHFLNFLRLREWRDLHRQLLFACRHMDLSINKVPAGYEAVHKALLSGLLTQIGLRHDEADYTGVRNRKFWIVQGSCISGKKPKWCMVGELVETSRVYARFAAKIEPQWIEPFAAPFIKINSMEPHWEKKRAQVIATEQVLFYGLIITTRKVNYAGKHPEEAREIFIRTALVEGEFATKLPFYLHNRQMIKEAEILEDKARKRDILIDDEVLFTFYNERLPAHVCSGSTLERWLKTSNREVSDGLCLQYDDLLQRDLEEEDLLAYPDNMKLGGYELPLSYVFSPGEKDDGVTVTVPVQLLSTLTANNLDWLVPGLLHEKIVSLLRALPKALRKNFVPVPQCADEVLKILSPSDKSFSYLLSDALFRIRGINIPEELWNSEALDDYFRMNIRVVDGNNKVLGEGRDLIQLRKRFAGQANSGVSMVAAEPAWGETGLIDWTFDVLPEYIEVNRDGFKVSAYPTLEDKGKSVDLILTTNPGVSREKTRHGLARLIALQLSEQMNYMVKSLKQLERIAMLAMKVMDKQSVVRGLQYVVINQLFLQNEASWPRDKTTFHALIEQKRGDIVETGEQVEHLLMDIFVRYSAIAKSLKGQMSINKVLSMNDIKEQLQYLIYPDFLMETPVSWLDRYPCYLKGIDTRLQKLSTNVTREEESIQEIQCRWQAYLNRKEHLSDQNRYDEKLMHYRWMLEEYRISLFAQTLKTCFPVSIKRLDRYWETIDK